MKNFIKKSQKKNKGITLIALVITVVVMLIISAVAITAITDPEGIFSQAREAGENYNTASQNEAEEVTDLIEELNGLTYQDPSGANAPKLLTGMTAVTFNTDGTTAPVTDKSKWYNYEEKHWANAETEDGSLWVWIPRFAYKITYTDTTVDPVNDPIDKSQGGTIDVVFLNGTTNNYTYETSDGTTATGTASATHDTSTYTLHPSFKKAVNGDYSHGEWDKELTGYWVAKFEAGWQQGNATATDTKPNDKTKAVLSNVTYQDSAATRYIVNLDNDTDHTNDKIPYPVFKGATYVMNYISIADSFAICRHLTDTNNIYGLSSSNADSHLMKNSEWGACAYLGYSQYGTNGQEVYINNANLNDTTNHIYAVTGYAGSEVSSEKSNGTLEGLNIWYTSDGQKGSNNYNITGVYDMSGGTWERVAGYIANGIDNLMLYGTVAEAETDKLIATTTKSNEVTTLSTKYSTMYRHNNENLSVSNYEQNLNMYGDATIETSFKGQSNTSWNTDYSVFVGERSPFFAYSGEYKAITKSGSFAYSWTAGGGNDFCGFRTVLCPI